LGQVEQLIEESDAGMGYIRYNWENSDEVEYLHHFMRVTSPFYPDLERLYQQRVDAWLESVAPHFDEEDDDLGSVASS
jgi:hypothetical protein